MHLPRRGNQQRIRQATIAGFDWGARTANIVAALWPERCKAMVSVSGYLVGNQEAGKCAAARGRAPMVVQRPASGGEIRVHGVPHHATRAETRRAKLSLLPEEPLRNACVAPMPCFRESDRGS